MERNNQNYDLKERLIAKMNENADRNGLEDRGKYISSKALGELFSEENLRAHVSQVFGYWSWPLLPNPERDSLVSKIQDCGRKLYAILIMLDRPEIIRELLYGKPEVDDRMLFGRNENEYYKSCSEATLQEIPQLKGIAKEFYKEQWHFPPKLYLEKTVQEFDPLYSVIPFVRKGHVLGSGSFGIVFGTEIEEEFIKPCKYVKDLKVAYKRVTVGRASKEKRQRIFNEVKVLQDRAHANVTELLGSFVAGIERPNPKGHPEESLYMIYPLADVDMDRWLETDPGGVNSDKMCQHIYTGALLGLASGVEWIHREIDGMVGYHRDLKPPNILLFSSGENEWLWKIADFGCANLKLLENTATTNTTASKYWAPPEFMENTDGRTHGRPHDVYSLGCVFLLLVTITVHGWTSGGVPAFQRNREEFKSQDNTQHQSTKGAFSECKEVVDNWIKDLKTRKPGNLKIKRVLDVIEHMLKPYNERITIWEVVVYLYDFTEQWKLELAYSDADEATFREKKVLEKLRDTIQPSRKIDMSMKITPSIRAKLWGWDSFNPEMKKNQWFESQPRTTNTLRKRGTVPGNVRSTLENNDLPKGPLFGYQKIFDQISRAFGDTNMVALCGMGGIGKSRVALTYAQQFTESDIKTQDQKHTFWVKMTDKKTIRDGYVSIAKKTRIISEANINKVDDSSLASSITKWLQNAESGQWILVVDDVHVGSQQDGDPSFLNLRALQEHGQILITTRDRGCAIGLLGEAQDKGCLKMEQPELNDRLRIYYHLTNQSMLPTSNPDNRALLEHFTLPGLINDAIQYMKQNQVTPAELLEDVEEKGFCVVQNFRKDLLDVLLQHLTERLDPEDKWRPEIQHLFILAMFGPQGASFELLSIEIEKDALRKSLGVLQNHHLVSRWPETSHADPNQPARPETFHVDPTVRAAIWAWIKDNEGSDRLSERFDKVLSMVYGYYDSKVTLVSAARFQLRAELLPHFERFVKFVKEESEQERSPQESQKEIEFAPRAIQAVIEFSRELLDRDRYGDAAEVLDFAQRHYPIEKARRQGPVDSDSKDKLNVRYRLEQQRMKTYLIQSIYPLKQVSTASWEAAKGIVERQAGEMKSWTGSPRYEFWKLVRGWELTLDLIRVYCYSETWEEAKKLFNDTSEINITIELVGGVEVPVMQPIEEIKSGLVDDTTKSVVDLKTIRERSLWMLGIRRKREEGRYYLLRGQDAKMNGAPARDIQGSWESAHEALHIAKVAVRYWFGEDEMLHEVLMHIAEVDTQLGTKKGLEKAGPIFAKAWDRVKQRHGSDCKRAWDVECRINAVRLKTKSDLNTATRSLEDLLDRYEKRFTKQARATVNCAYQLREAYIACHRYGEVDKLSERIPIMPRIDRRCIDEWVVTWAIPAGAFVAMLVLVGSRPVRMWLVMGTRAAARMDAACTR